MWKTTTERSFENSAIFAFASVVSISFFAALARTAPDHSLVYQSTGSPLDRATGLRAITADVAHATAAAIAE
jgi:hypothetical protein